MSEIKTLTEYIEQIPLKNYIQTNMTRKLLKWSYNLKICIIEGTLAFDLRGRRKKC